LFYCFPEMRASTLLSCQNRWCLCISEKWDSQRLSGRDGSTVLKALRKGRDPCSKGLLYLRLYARVYCIIKKGLLYLRLCARVYYNTGSAYSRAFVTVEPSLQDTATAIPASLLYCAEARWDASERSTQLY
jgi:hypothetical protein